MTFNLEIGENHLCKIRGILLDKHFEIKLCLYFSVSQEKKMVFTFKAKSCLGIKVCTDVLH